MASVITGRVGPSGEATIPLRVHDRHGEEHYFTVVIDTGFDGYLALPSVLVTALGLVAQSETVVTLGDGKTQELPTFRATVIWHDAPLPVRAYVAEGVPLIGLALLYGSDISIRLLDGGAVTISAI